MSLRKLALAATARVSMIALVSLLILSVMVPNTAYCQSPPPTDPYVYVLVNSTVYASLSSALSTYKQDLEKDGFSVEIKQSDMDFGNSAEAIREFLQTEAETHEIAGVLLVGNITIVKFEIWYGTFPCDFYYMDLDGNWTDSDGNGIYDMHTDETGDLRPEIWVGRLYASTMTGNETELLINYFDKNHRFRTGELKLPRRSIGYIDDEFLALTGYPDVVNSSLRMIYRNETTLVTDPETTNAADYKNRLNDTLGYEWLFLAAHSSQKKHCFNTSEGWTYVYSSEVRSIDPRAFFYHFMACKVADYSYTDYIGGSYVFADTYGLLLLGSTASGGMNYINDFYGPIAEGKSIGQAFIEYCGKVPTFNPNNFNYGLTILGDPTLYPHMNNLTVLAEDQYGINLTTGYVYIDGQYRGHTGSSFMVSMGTHTVWVSDFWEAGQTGYRYIFQHWEEDNSTDNPRTIPVIEDTTIKAVFNKCDTTTVPLPNWGFEEIGSSVCECPPWESNNGGWRELRSDVDEDGEVNVMDLLHIKIALALEKTPAEEPTCDLDGDGDIDAMDMLTVKIDLTLEKEWGKNAFKLDGDHSWYTSGGGDYQMWQWLDSDAIQSVAGQNVMFSFQFYPESVASDVSRNNARAEIYYEYDGGNNTCYGVWIGPRELGWWNAYITASLPSNITAFKVTIHGTPNFKAWVDLAQLCSIE